MSFMQDHESLERFVVGLKTAADRARQLGKAQKNKSWHKVAAGLDGVRVKGEKLYNISITHQQNLDMVDRTVGKLSGKPIQ